VLQEGQFDLAVERVVLGVGGQEKFQRPWPETSSSRDREVV